MALFASGLAHSQNRLALNPRPKLSQGARHQPGSTHNDFLGHTGGVPIIEGQQFGSA